MSTLITAEQTKEVLATLIKMRADEVGNLAYYGDETIEWLRRKYNDISTFINEAEAANNENKE